MPCGLIMRGWGHTWKGNVAMVIVSGCESIGREGEWVSAEPGRRGEGRGLKC